MLEGANQISAGDIAIVGMALRVPGARNVDEFWKNLRGGVESIRTYSPEELVAAGEDPGRIHHPNYVPRGAELPDMEMFDAEFFGLNPKEAAIMDPQHRQFLECAWEAMEDAGRTPTPHAHSGPVGIFAGCGMGSYFFFNVCSNRNLVDQVGMFLLRHTGNDKDFLATRASFTFDLRGPSVNVQTACSTSLVATHYACQSLISGECDMALAGGVTIEFPHRHGYLFQEGEILSPDGHCRAFDHRAAGTVFGSGVGVVVLRRLSDALRDGDVIHAVIKGTAVNNDGNSKAGYLAPSVSGQAEAVLEAHGLAGVAAETIQYVECHGTGTFLGDPIEIEALTAAFRQSTDKTGFCHVGSVKSNIGHLDTAAGVVGLIKAVLAIKHGEIPPTLGFERPNPSIDFERSPFRVNSKLLKWPQISGPRRAAVNSLGVGGTNAHAILEQAPCRYVPASETVGSQADDADPLLLFLSARQRKTLDAMTERLASTISSQPDISLDDISYTLRHGRRHFDHRMVLAVRNRQDAITALSNAASRGFVHQHVPAQSGTVFLFPGGGVQYVGMAKRLYSEDPKFRSTVDEGLSYLPADVAARIRKTWLVEGSPAAAEAFLRPSLQLPAILIAEIGLARLWMEWGVKPKALIGHSMGENAAACVAGVMSFQDAVHLVHLRGQLFETIRPSGMLSVPIDRERLAELRPPSLDVASINAPSLCVVSGLNEDLEAFRETLAKQGIDATRVPINIAAHSRLVDPILKPFETFLRSIALRAPTIPILSNRTGLPLSAEEATDPMYWVGHLRSTVHFADGLATLSADPGLVYIEVGPGRVLSSLTKAQGSVPANQVINSLPHPDENTDDRLYFLSAVGRVWAVGIEVDIDRIWEGRSPRRVRLPTYPFQHRRFFIDRAAVSNSQQAAESILSKEPDIERWGYRPAWKRTLADYEPGNEKDCQSWLFFLDEGGFGLRLVERLRSEGHRVVTVSLGDAFVRHGSAAYMLCPEFGRSGYDALIAGLAADKNLPTRIVHMWLLTQQETFRSGSNFFHRNQECGFDSLLHLAQALGDAGGTADVHFTLVTNGMHQVGDEPLPYPEKATILGPGLVMPKEMAGVTVKVIDVDLPRDGGEGKTGFFSRRKGKGSGQGMLGETSLVEQLWEDLHAKPGSELVAYRNGRRWTQIHQRMPLREIASEGTTLRRHGVYFVSGGLSEIALALAGKLASQFQARLVLVGRIALPPREEWDFYERTHGHDNIRRAVSAIRAMEEKGAEVLYLQGDVGNPEQMAHAVEASLARFGEINGVFHAAGVVDDGLIQTKTRDQVERVLTPKVLGTTVLDAAFENVKLDFFLMFSSTSTDVVRAGQVDYVAANAYLNAFAQSRSRRTDRATIALHWGVWNEVGLAARALGLAVDQDRVRPVAGPASGPFFQHWTEDETGTPWLEATISPQTEWMLNEHRLVSGQAVMPGTGYLELIAQAAREYGLPLQADMEDLVFLKPLVFADGDTKTLRVRLESVGERFRVAIVAGPAEGGETALFVKHAEATLTPREVQESRVVDVPALALSFGERRVAVGDETLRAVQENHIRFGPRWAVLHSVAIHKREALAELRLDSCFAEDLTKGMVLHPALLDIATGFALELAAGYAAAAGLWAPAAYGRIVLHKRLPTEIISHVRLSDSSDLGEGYAAFDVMIMDRLGNLVFEAERFVMRRLESDVALGISHPEVPTASHKKHATPSPALLKLGTQVRNGILPEEGFTALLRALGTSEPQPIISSIDLELLRNWVAATAEPAAPTGDNFERPDLDSEFVAPRNPIEETLAGYWRELLGIARIGIHDGFFDVGGHSLIAVRLFRMIKKEYGLDLPISMLFEAPTIAQCAERIAAERPQGNETVRPETKAAEVSRSKPLHLVLMNPGRNAEAAPLFICAGMFGNILNLRHLAMCMGADRPVYGLQARGLYGDNEPHLTFEEMAADYIAEIKTVQPHGPYLLAGYSGGGIAAYEIARQLVEAGEQVAHVVMLDTPQPREPELAFLDRVVMKMQDIRRHKRNYLGKYLRDRRRSRAENLARQEAERQVGTTEHFNNEKIEMAFRRAAFQYQVKPYAGSVTLFRPKPAVFYRLSGGRCLRENRAILLPDNGWSEHVGALRVSEVPGDHDSMVLDPYVRVLAERMRAVVADAAANSGIRTDASHARDGERVEPQQVIELA
ncbi:acyl transferase domain-containing protein [Neorhizobium sp. R1-B]|uniref:type I polyketide synthase n=1 Tax=unclassified Neorhizobium TaxID=2629175 RepID=UPI00104B81D6|nr:MULTISPECIES: type I polyketide synthase [unclassified Neorhizobium]TCV70029.1 acyl transferase domain-containing protein [Neorhizobium sp. S3-V5DH]TDX80371.1 acyl transferase domain-containing protein [Neorhizobium sp. R1-B]